MGQKASLTFIDIFSGAGGLSCGLEMAGLVCLLGIEKMPSAFQTFAINHRRAAVYPTDVSLLSEKRILELVGHSPIDLVVGGPPCQGFSTVGTGDPKDVRNHLFREFIRITNFVKPSFVLIENVTGLLAKKNESTLRAIIKCLDTLGFHSDVRVLSSQHYGVPEIRRRTVILGTKLPVALEFPKPTYDCTRAGVHRPPVTLGEVLEDLADRRGQIHNHDLEYASAISEIDKKRLLKIPEGCGIRYEKDSLAYLPPRLRQKSIGPP